MAAAGRLLAVLAIVLSDFAFKSADSFIPRAQRCVDLNCREAISQGRARKAHRYSADPRLLSFDVHDVITVFSKEAEKDGLWGGVVAGQEDKFGYFKKDALIELNIFHTSLPHIVPTKERLQGNVQEEEEETSHNHPPAPQDHLAPEYQGENPRTMQGMEDPSVQKSQVPNAEGMVQYMGQEEEDQGAKPIRVQWEHLNYDHPAEQARQNGAPPQEQQHGMPTHEEHPHHEVPHHMEEGQPEQWTGSMQHGSQPDNQQGWPQETPPQAQYGTPHAEDPSPYGTDHQYQQRDDQPPHNVHGESPGSHEEAPHQADTEGHESRIEQPDTHRKKVKVKVLDMGANDEDKDLSNMDVEDLNEYLESLYQDMGEEKPEEQEGDVEKEHQKDVEEQQVDTEREQEEDVHKMQHMDREDGQHESTDGELLKDAEWGKQEEQDDIESKQQEDTGEQQEDVEEVQHKGTEDGQETGEGQWEDEERMQQDTGRDALQEDVEEKKWEDSEGQEDAGGNKEDLSELDDEEQAGDFEREEIGDDQDKEEEGDDEEEVEEEEGGDEDEEEEGDDEEEWEEEVDGEEEEEGDAVEEEGDWNIDEDRGDLQEGDHGEKEMAKRDFEEEDEHGKEKTEKEEETDLDVQQDESKEDQERIEETAIPSTEDDDESSEEIEIEESEDSRKQTTDSSSTDEADNIELDVEDDNLEMETKGDENTQVEDTEDEEKTQEDGKGDVTELRLEEDGNDKATDDGTDGLKDGTKEESEEGLMEDENAVAANQLHKPQEADDSFREENNEVGQKEEIMSQDLTPEQHHIEDEIPENWGSSMGEESAELQKQEIQQEDRSQEEGMDSATIKAGEEEPSEALHVAEGEDIPEEEEQLEDENAAAAASGLEQSDEEKDVESTMLDDSMRQPEGDQMEDENNKESQDSSQLIEQTFEGVIETEGLPEEKTESLPLEDSDGISEMSDGLMAVDKEELRSDKVEETELDNEALDKQHMVNNLKTNDQEATDELFKDLIQKTPDEEVENLDIKMDQASGFDSKASEVNSDVEKLLETPQLKEMQEKIMDITEAISAKTKERTERLLSQLESKLPFSSGSSKNVGSQDDTDENLTLKPEPEAKDAEGEGMQVEEDKDKEKIESLFPFGSGQDARQQLREQVEKLTKSDYAYQKQQEKMRQEMLEWTAKMKEKREEARKAKENRGETVIDGTTVNWDEVLEDDVPLSTEDLPFDWDEVLDKEAFMSEYSQIMEQPFGEDIMPTSVLSSHDSMMSTPAVDMMTEVLDSGDDLTEDLEKDVAKPVMEQTLEGSEVPIDVGETTSLGAVEPTTTQQTEPLQSAHISQTILPSDQGASQVPEYGQVLPDEPARGYGWDGQSAERTLNLYLEGARREEIIDKVGLGSDELDALRAAEDKEEELAPDHETVMEETVEGMKEDAEDDKAVVTDQTTDVGDDMAVVTDQPTDVDDDVAVVIDQHTDVDGEKAVEEEATSEPVTTSELEAAEEEENVPQIDAEDIYIELDFQFIAKLGALVPPEWAEQLRGWGLEYTPSDLIFQGIPVPWLAVITTLLVGIVTFCVFSYKCVTRCVRGKPVDPAVVKRQLEAELEKYAKEKEDLKKGTEAAEDRIRELEETLDVEKFSAQALSKKNSELEAKMSDNDQLELTLRQEIKRLMDQVTDAREQLESATSEYAQQQEIEAEYKKTIKKERKEKEKLQDRLTDFESKSKQLDSEIVSIREHRDLLEESKHQLEEQIQGRQEQFNELKESIEMIKQENEQLKDNVQYKENEIEVLRDCLMQIKALESEDAAAMEEETEDASTAKDEKIQQMLDVARINSTLKLVESERDYLRSRLEEADNSKKEYEEKTNRLTLQVDNLSEARKRADKQYYEAQVRLNTLQDYFKEKEVELQRKLGKEEMIRQDVSGKVQDVEEQYRLAKEQVELYQNQKDDLLKEMQESERSYRNQIAAIEKKAHESWMAARTSEREAQDSKREAATLRQKLLEAENTLAKEKSKYLVQSPPLIKPTPINGPPPFPPRFSPPLPPPGAPRHGPPFGRSPPQGHNGDFDGPPSPPPEMAFRGPPPPMGPPPLGPPPFRGPPDDFPDRDFDRRPGSERDFDHMPPSDRDFDRRPPSEPYSLPERDFGPDRDFAPGPYRGPPMDFPPPLRGGPPPMTPPSLRRGSAPLPPMPRGPPPPSGRISGPRELRGPPPPRRPDSRSTGPPSPPPMGIPRTSSPLDSPQHYMGPPPPGGPPPQHFSPHGPPPPRRSPNPPPMGRRPPPSDDDRRDRPPQQSSRLPT